MIDWRKWARSEIRRLTLERYANVGRGSGKSWSQYRELRRMCRTRICMDAPSRWRLRADG